MSAIVAAPLLVALAGAIGCLLLRSRPRLLRGVSLLAGVGYLLATVALARAVYADGDAILVYYLSGWQAPYGITLVADRLSVIFIGLTAIVSLAALWVSIKTIDASGQRISYHALYQFMVVGITGSFLTADIFNLFVWFEVMLMASYVLVVFHSGPEQTRAGMQYVVLNLLGSAVMLLAIGGLYATTGTLNMADIARRLAEPAAYGIAPGPVLGLTGLLLCVFALKAGLVPFQFWVPGAYQAAPPPVTAMLAGVVKKVGIYAIIRLYFSVFAVASIPDAGGLAVVAGKPFLVVFGGVILVMALLSILLGGIGAAGRNNLDALLAYSSISQVGFIVLPLAVAATTLPGDSLFRAGVLATIVYAIIHGFAKGVLFLVSGAIEDHVGTLEFSQLGGISEQAPVLSGAFFVGGLTLIGIPPLFGFFGKLLVFKVGVDAQNTIGWIAVGATLIGAILTITYVTRAWERAFWGPPNEFVEELTASPSVVAVIAGLAIIIIALGIGFQPVYELANGATSAVIDTDAYVRAVLGPESAHAIGGGLR